MMMKELINGICTVWIALVGILFCIDGLFPLASAHAFDHTDLDSSRRSDWTLAGYPGKIPDVNAVIIDVRAKGAQGDATSDDHAAIQQAIDGANAPAVIFFPTGRFKIGSALKLKSGLVLRGAGSDASQLEFTSTNGCIHIQGSATGDAVALVSGYTKDSRKIVVADATGFQVGQGGEIQQENITAVDPKGEWGVSWGEKCIGQMVKIVAIDGNTLTIDPPLNFTYTAAMHPEIVPLRYVQDVGIEDLTIKRIDTGSETSNVTIRRAADIWVRHVESDNTEKYHFAISRSLHVEIRDSYIHDAFRKGNGGQGYGTSLSRHVTAVLVENNIFSDLRHAMIVQLGTSGSVFGYNYAQRNYSDVAGEGIWDKAYISVHGHYALVNLFEGNIVGKIDISDYWGPSGPGNTMFRNRCMGTDKHMDFGPYRGITIDDYSHDQNILANELVGGQTAITFDGHTDSSQGTSTGAILHGNNIHGEIQWDPAITDHSLPVSLYLASKPAFFGSMTWPAMGPEFDLGAGTIPAKARFDAGTAVEQPGNRAPTMPTGLQMLKLASAN